MNHNGVGEEIDLELGDSHDRLLEALRVVPELRQATAIEPILKGYSPDRKFKVTVPSQGHYLVRTYDSNQEAKKQAEFQWMHGARQIGVMSQLPVAMGRLDEGQGYMVLSYIEGEDASDVLPRLSEKVQRDIGMQAGAQLRMLHRLQVRDLPESWFTRKSKKHRRYMEKYVQCPIVMKRDESILAYIDSRLPLMKHRPDRFQHDDFHPGNLIVKDGRLAGIIDFSRFDQGDPIHEFLKLGLFGVEASIPYAIGQVEGYCGGNRPDETFWALYSLYLAMALVSSVVWIQQVKPEETDDMMAKIERVREEHDDFRRIVPRWYNESS